MEDKLIELLETFGFPVYRQGSLADGESYDDTFFTFWNRSENEHTSHDNRTTSVLYEYDVNVYSNDTSLVYSLQRKARKLLEENDFIITSRGHDVVSDEKTHIGRGMTIQYLEREV